MPHTYRRRRNLQGEVQRGNPVTAVLGEDLEITDEVADLIRQTNQNDIDINTKKNYRNRICEIYQYWEKNHAAYLEIGTYELSIEDKANPDRLYHNNNRDMLYESINIKFVLTFLVVKKNLTCFLCFNSQI